MELISYKDLMQMNAKELRDLGKEMGCKLAPNMGEETIREAIMIENAKREQRMKAKVSAALQSEATEKLGLGDQSGARPMPEDIAILASKRFYVKFINLEQASDGPEPGATVEFTKGTHRFALYDDRIHCLPGVLLAEDVDQVPNVLEALVNFWRNAGLKAEATRSQPGANEMARQVIGRLSIMGTIRLDRARDVNATSATYPVFRDATLPSGERVSQLSGHRKRWDLQIIGDASPDTPFGLVTDSKELNDARHSKLVPLG